MTDRAGGDPHLDLAGGRIGQRDVLDHERFAERAADGCLGLCHDACLPKTSVPGKDWPQETQAGKRECWAGLRHTIF